VKKKVCTKSFQTSLSSATNSIYPLTQYIIILKVGTLHFQTCYWLSPHSYFLLSIIIRLSDGGSAFRT